MIIKSYAVQWTLGIVANLAKVINKSEYWPLYVGVHVQIFTHHFPI
jgi:hypothetical protein